MFAYVLILLTTDGLYELHFEKIPWDSDSQIFTPTASPSPEIILYFTGFDENLFRHF